MSGRGDNQNKLSISSSIECLVHNSENDLSCKCNLTYFDGDGKEETPKMQNIETPLLIAAKNGIRPMVKQILEEIPMAIHDKSEGKQRTASCSRVRKAEALDNSRGRIANAVGNQVV
ncbi:ankyrin repeat-containing protein [Fagus crenata]